MRRMIVALGGTLAVIVTTAMSVLSVYALLFHYQNEIGIYNMEILGSPPLAWGASAAILAIRVLLIPILNSMVKKRIIILPILQMEDWSRIPRSWKGRILRAIDKYIALPLQILSVFLILLYPVFSLRENGIGSSVFTFLADPFAYLTGEANRADIDGWPISFFVIVWVGTALLYFLRGLGYKKKKHQ